jgi:hypothetical protein
MKRDQALDHVKKLTMDDRNKTHGDAVKQFEHAQRIKAAVGHHDSPHLTPAEIEAIEMICLKLSRWTTAQRGQTSAEKWADHALDIIGYAAIAVEAIYATEVTPAEMQRRINTAPAVSLEDELERREAEKAAVPSPFVGVNQVARRFAPNPRQHLPEGTRKVEPPEGSASAPPGGSAA